MKTKHEIASDLKALESERKYLLKIIDDELAANELHQTTFAYVGGIKNEFKTRLYMFLDNVKVKDLDTK